MSDRDPNIIISGLSRTVTIDDITVDVQIHRIEHEALWWLEVVNELGTSTVWDDPFDTDEAAFAAFEEAVAEDGMKTFLDDDITPTVH